MACGATLKRSHEFDPLHSPTQGTPKRRRCIMPMTLSPSTPPTKQTKSVFSDASSKLTSEQIAARISIEIKKMQRRRQLHYQGSGGNSPPHCSSSELSNFSGMDSPPHSSQSSTSLFNAMSPTKKDIPLFTIRQVSMLCDRMIKEREEQIQEQYDGVLTSKLAEQYEAFLKFNHDQLQKRFGDAPMSYVS